MLLVKSDTTLQAVITGNVIFIYYALPRGMRSLSLANLVGPDSSGSSATCPAHAGEPPPCRRVILWKQNGM